MRSVGNSTAGEQPLDLLHHPDAAWSAVLARDSRLDGRFVYAVSSTGVYCRPTCPSRRPRRANVAFFPTPAAAERAGFRACRRCRPHASVASGATDAVARACAIIERSADGPPTLAELASQVGLSRFYLQRVFKRLTGLTPAEYAAAGRTERFKTRLRHGDTVSRATYEAGYGSSSRVYEQASARLGMTPATYRRGGRGAHIRYTLVDSPFGRLLVAGTDRGVCAVSMGDDDATLINALTSEYPHATLERADSAVGEWVMAIVRHLQGERQAMGVPLDIGGTAFQRRVWKALCEIPFGVTRSYAEVASAIGSPTAARAVASACARNPVSLVVPCHRVVRQGGALGGYRWGLDRKRKLLAQERSVARSNAEDRLPSSTIRRS